MLIIGPSGSGKTNALLHLVQKLNNTNPIDKIYLYAKDLSEPKYEFLINIREMILKMILKIKMILMNLLNILMLWMMFLKILMITI